MKLLRRLDPGAIFAVSDTHSLKCSFFLNEAGFHPNQPILVLEKPRFAEKHFMVAPFDVNNWCAGTCVHGAAVTAKHAADVSSAQKPKAVSVANRTSGTHCFDNRVEEGLAQFCSRRSIFFIQKNLTGQSAVDYTGHFAVGESHFEKIFNAEKPMPFLARNTCNTDPDGRRTKQAINVGIKGKAPINKSFQRRIGAQKIGGRSQNDGIRRAHGIDDRIKIVLNNAMFFLEQTTVTPATGANIEICQSYRHWAYLFDLV